MPEANEHENVEDVGDLTERLDLLQIADVGADVSEFGTRALIIPRCNDIILDAASKSCKWTASVHELDDGSMRISNPSLASGGGHGHNEVPAVVQSCDEVHFTLIQVKEHEKDNVHYLFFFEPHDEALLFRKTIAQDVHFENVSDPNVPPEVDEYRVCRLFPSCYRATLGGSTVDIKVLPRRPCILLQSDTSLSAQLSVSKRSSSGGLKRSRPSSPSTSPSQVDTSQRRKGDELDDVSQQVALEVWPVDLQMNKTLTVPQSGSQQSYDVTSHKQLLDGNAARVIVASKDGADDKIVIKFLKYGLGQRLPYMRRWVMEHKIHSQLKHKNIVQLLFADARYLALYLEYVPGPNLGQIRDDGWSTLSPSSLARVQRGLAAALCYIHDQGIIHNDIRPANILFCEERGSVLCDFGIASMASDPSPSKNGTPWYTPPEFINDGVRDMAGDVWAAGISMLWAMKRIRLPELRPQSLFWAVHKVRDQDQDAVAKWLEWIREVEAATSQLDASSMVAGMTKSMLELHAEKRVTAGVLDARLNGSESEPLRSLVDDPGPATITAEAHESVHDPDEEGSTQASTLTLPGSPQSGTYEMPLQHDDLDRDKG